MASRINQTEHEEYDWDVAQILAMSMKAKVSWSLVTIWLSLG